MPLQVAFCTIPRAALHRGPADLVHRRADPRNRVAELLAIGKRDHRLMQLQRPLRRTSRHTETRAFERSAGSL